MVVKEGFRPSLEFLFLFLSAYSFGHKDVGFSRPIRIWYCSHDYKTKLLVEFIRVTFYVFNIRQVFQDIRIEVYPRN